jgi:hypothetical protein
VRVFFTVILAVLSLSQASNAGDPGFSLRSVEHQDVVVFFAAHPDDETLGMAGSIARAVQSGSIVLVELMTKGKASGARYSFSNLSEEEFGQARVNEFTAAVKGLGVRGAIVNDFPDGALQKEQVETRIKIWMDLLKREKLKSLSFVGTLGGGHDYNDHPDHNAVYQALLSSELKNVTWQSVYHYRNPDRDKAVGNLARGLSVSECDSKRKALLEYKFEDPKNLRLGIGWLHSTGDLFDGAYADCREFILARDQSKASDQSKSGTQPVKKRKPWWCPLAPENMKCKV